MINNLLTDFLQQLNLDELVKSLSGRHPSESRGPDTVPVETGIQTIEPGFRLSPE
jgi:hypothetical protein